MTGDETADNVLIGLYERYIGEPETEADVYLGFSLFFTAIAFAVLAVSLFAAATSLYGIREGGYFSLAQPAYLLGMLSIPLALTSVTVLLPNERRVEWVGAAGTVVTLVAAGIFLLYYPDQWFEFGTTQTLVVVGTYAVGLAVVTASTGAALVAYRLEQARAPLPSEIQAGQDDAEEGISEEQIRSDIDEAMSEVDLTLGGIEREENRRLEFTADLGDEGEFRGTDVEPEKTVSPGGVDTNVEGLQQLKSGDPKAQTSESTVDDETAALNELKKRKEQDEVPDPAADDGIFANALSKLGLR
jgi:hypothetical protein